MRVGSKFRIAAYTQFVPLFMFASCIFQFFVADYRRNKDSTFEKEIDFYEFWSSVLPGLFIFFSLETNSHYLWNVSLNSTLFVVTMVFINVKRDLLVEGEFSIEWFRPIHILGMNISVFVIATVVSVVSY